MYHNPVYRDNFADPFCLHFGGEYWCFCSGFWKDRRVFGVLHSLDLVNWQELPGAMEPLASNPPYYWAPEVSYLDGKFYLYYSAGNEEFMHLRVAVADHPAGPYIDSGRQLTTEQFAIDAHVFEDEDGARYLFYASDHLERDRVGTGTVVDRLLTPLQLAGKPAPVSLPAYDWQIYDPKRASKNNLRWHTIEGSFTLKYKGRYYQMFSGGNYHNISYGVSYAVTDDIQSGKEWDQHCDGVNKSPVLCSVMGEVNGPGHNSVVVGPDQRQLFCVYHVITEYEPLTRVMAIDRLEWVSDELVVLGPTYQPQPAPIRSENPFYPGRVMDPRSLIEIGSAGTRLPDVSFETPYFLFHLVARAIGGQKLGDGVFGIAWRGPDGQVILRISWIPKEHAVLVSSIDGNGQARQDRQELAQFDFEAWHTVLVELNGYWARLKIPGAAWSWEGSLGGRVAKAAFFTEKGAETPLGELKALGITYGSSDLFWSAPNDLALTGWRVNRRGQDGKVFEPMDSTARAAHGWRIKHGKLTGSTANEAFALVKDLLLRDYELVVNAGGVDDRFVIYPALARDGGSVLKVWVARGSVHVQTQDQTAQVQVTELPQAGGFLQLRFRKEGGRIHMWVGRQDCGEFPAPAEACRVGLAVQGEHALFDLVRITKII